MTTEPSSQTAAPRRTRAGKPEGLATSDGAADANGTRAVVGTVTPSMAQFLEIKAANPDCILWYRMGDFYELFFEDAVVAAEALGIVLTKRGKHLGEDIPMCGVPVHRADEYLQRLIRQGFRVAVCEQLEDPAEARKRGSKAVVKRDVVRLVTPGTLTEDTLLDAKARNYLTALFEAPGRAGGRTAETEAAMPHSRFALASLDISTGEFEVCEIDSADLPGELIRLSPAEILVAESTDRDAELRRWFEVAGAVPTPVARAFYDSLSGEHLMKTRLGVADLRAFGTFSRAELAAVGALLKYVDLTQIGHRPVLRPPRRAGSETHLLIDASSRTSLELTRSASGDRQTSLLGSIDRTVTGPGARELAERLASPLKCVARINARLDAVAFLVDLTRLRDDVRASLRGAPDIARAISRLALQRGGPRDLAALRDGLAIAERTSSLLLESGDAIGLPEELASIASRLSSQGDELHAKLAAALVDEPPHLKRDGGFVRPGYRDDLDEARGLGEDSRKVIAALEGKYSEATGVKALKIRHNNILGYFVEVTALNAKALTSPPHDAAFRHKQTMANAMRFTTEELVALEGRIASAGERALGIEQEIFNELAGDIAARTERLAGVASALAELDVHAALAELAVVESYARPELDDSIAFEIESGRHPVVELSLKRDKAGPFIENDCVLGAFSPAPTGFDEAEAKRLWLVTGPNMAGKSTFLRQNALIVVLAQMGAFVPASVARIGIVDRLFSRVGASDDLARGRSTFMVEMVETAAILNQATDRSLVILDEIGRGTATYDGLSIAWATVEHLHDVNRCRTLFATHYHELTALAGRLAEVANVTVDVKEWQDEIVFLHKVRPGAADRSYGIQVAKLAGLPQAVVGRAGEVLRKLEASGSSTRSPADALDDLPLFAASRPTSFVPQPAQRSAAEKMLEEINPDELTPKQALEALYKLTVAARETPKS